ncbi:hypothetical protein ACK8HX_04490 [Oryzobacter sp. R7]|uniref:hypothetical protein n=1 Tax=Oryzobacter faecalis TaxID=3388656 RepID=UPI00398C9F3F
MAAGLTRPTAPPGTDRVRVALLVVSTALLLAVGLTAPNAAQPDLGPRGWVPGTLVPVGFGPATVTGLLWAAYLAAAVAVVLGLRSGTGPLRSWRVPGALGVLALLSAPFGSADHVNYVAYGRILVTGGDPWVERPVDWGGGADPVTSRVEAPWTEEASVYGPFGTLLHGLSALVGGENLRVGVWVWQVLVVLAWLALRWGLRRVLPEDAHGRVDVLWTLNPLVLGIGVLGAHIDVVAAALVVAAVAAAVAGHHVTTARAAASGVLVALAGSTKITYAVVAVGLLAAWWATGTRGAAWARAAAAHLVGFVLAGVALHAWAGPHVYDQLVRSRQAVSLATPWRPLLEWGRGTVGNSEIRLLISIAAAVLAVVLALCLLRLTRPVDRGAPGVVALWVTGCLALAYSLAAPYALPWYDLLAWGALPALVAGPVDVLATLRLTALAVAYVPGRVVGMTPGVEEVTLGVRRGVVPWVGLALWLAVIVAGARPGSWRSSAPPRRGRGAPPTR